MSRLGCVIGAEMQGSVPHHAGHIIGYTPGEAIYDNEGNVTGYESDIPIYCNGHNVSGQINEPRQDVMFIQGLAGAVIGSSGPSNDECDGSDFITIEASSSVFIKGKPLVLVGDRVTLNPGDGIMISANQNKYYVSR